MLSPIKKFLVREFNVNSVKFIIILQWLIFLITLFLVLYESENASSFPDTLIISFLAFALFNLAAPFLFKYLAFNKYLHSIFLVDVIFITLSIYLTKGFNTDLYMVYFIIIFMSALANSLKSSMLIAFVVLMFYFGLVMRNPAKEILLDTRLLLRIPFLFVVAVVSGYFGEETKKREQHSEHLEVLFSEAKKQLYRSTQWASIGKLIVTVINDIGLPINKILEKSKHIIGESEKKHPDLSSDKIKTLSSEIFELATHGHSTLHELNDFTDQILSADEVVDINNSIENTITLMSYSIVNKGIVLKKDFSDNSPKAFCNKIKLQQVFVNIINNALNALPPGGHLIIESKKSGDYNLIEFIDNGPGVSDENKTALFEPFYSSIGEAGLGLTISREIIAGFNGKLTVSDSKDGGATFTILLPGHNLPIQNQPSYSPLL